MPRATPVFSVLAHLLYEHVSGVHSQTRSRDSSAEPSPLILSGRSSGSTLQQAVALVVPRSCSCTRSTTRVPSSPTTSSRPRRCVALSPYHSTHTYTHTHEQMPSSFSVFSFSGSCPERIVFPKSVATQQHMVSCADMTLNLLHLMLGCGRAPVLWSD